MTHFAYQSNQLCLDNILLADIAKQYGTPCYVYSEKLMIDNLRAYQTALLNQDHLICYAVKANSNLHLLKSLAEQQCGFDIVSGGELARCLQVGVAAERLVFSGVGKRDEEITSALAAGIYCFNVESAAELQRITEIARKREQIAPIALRVNPDVDAKTHPYISTGLSAHKFGISTADAFPLLLAAAENPHLQLRGIACHIGSQLTELAPYVDAGQRVFALVDRLSAAGVSLEFVNLGGGLGICYQDETPPTPAELCQALLPLFQQKKLRLLLEPGRSIIGAAGVLLTQVLYTKSHGDLNFAIVDAAMNDNIRPALYQAWQQIQELKQDDKLNRCCYDVVGPVCETGDFLGKARHLALQAGDYLAVRDVGAYGFSMSCQYNSRPRAAEVLINEQGSRVIRKRENLSDLWQAELGEIL